MTFVTLRCILEKKGLGSVMRLIEENKSVQQCFFPSQILDEYADALNY